VCDFARDDLVSRGARTAVVMSESADWTRPLDKEYLKCLPQAGPKVLAHIRFSKSTQDFTPVYNRIEALHPDVVIAGWAHVGVVPTVQWHGQGAPGVLAGVNAQAGSGRFWKATNGAAQNVITEDAAAPGEALTPKTVPFTNAYIKRFGVTPAYNAYSTYDALFVLEQAIERAGSTQPGALVPALEKTDYRGTLGRVEFYGRHARYAHGMKYGERYVTGSMIQWQHGKQVAIWPRKAATGSPKLPALEGR